MDGRGVRGNDTLLLVLSWDTPGCTSFLVLCAFISWVQNFAAELEGCVGNRSDYNVWFSPLLPIGTICWNVRGGGGGMSKAWASPWWYEDVTSCLQAIHNIPMSAWEQADIWRKEGANCPQSDRRRREKHRGNSILCKIKTDGHTGAHQFEIIDLLGAVQKFLPRLFPLAQNKNRSLNKSKMWKVLFC